MMKLSSKIYDSLNQLLTAISVSEWQKLFDCNYPFMRHEFLLALEQSNCCCEKTGWQPQHIAIFEQQQIVAVIPCYLKHHSYGEYIFDWSWAEAYQQHNLDFYPKLTCAIPYTPATGPRIGIHPNYRQQLDAILVQLNHTLTDYQQRQTISNWQMLFNQVELSNKMTEHGWLKRNNVQFHWFNRNYQHFDDFTAQFSSRKRKNLRKERKAVAQSNIEITRIQGAEITPSQWQQFHLFYQATYLKRSGHGGYLNLAFFQQLGQTMPEQLMMVVAYKQQEIVAAALYFHCSNTLYGRYWGCLETEEYLHFECCYYQGIEFCIEQGIQRFDAGAQGEHKIQRGFEPVETYANYHIIDPRFSQAIEHYLQQEWQHNQMYLAAAKTKLPFKKQ